MLCLGQHLQFFKMYRLKTEHTTKPTGGPNPKEQALNFSVRICNMLKCVRKTSLRK
jgi:ribosomal protein S4E